VPFSYVYAFLFAVNSNPGLVGDGSKLHILPIVRKGNHSDLKEITPADLVALTEGQYSEDVKSFEVIDCRYPYEYEGGHIRGAINLHTKRQIYERFFGSKGPCISVEEGRRHIIVFHCEFSSQRAPDM
jgi:M-phase inducer phosphatase 2